MGEPGEGGLEAQGGLSFPEKAEDGPPGLNKAISAG